MKSRVKSKKIKSLMVIGDAIKQIKNYGPTCKRHSNLRLAIESNMDAIA
jgi:hypothetical protein